MKKRLIQAVVLLLVLCLTWAAGTAESMHRETENPDFDLEVSVGYNGLMTYGKAMPVKVRIRNFGGDFEGTLGVNAYISSREYDRYETAVAVPAGSQREYTLAVRVYTRQDVFTAEIVKDGEVLGRSSAKPERVVNPSSMLIGVLSTRPGSLACLNITSENDVLSRFELWQTVPLTAETFPEDVKLLRSFGMLVIDDLDPASLSPKQQEVLDEWLRGGRIVLAGGGAAGGRNAAYFNGYTGLSLKGMASSDDVLPQLEHLIGRKESGRKVSVTLAEYEGADPLASDEEGHGLIYRSEASAGRIYTTAFEAGDSRLNSESLMHYFWQQLLLDMDQELYSSAVYSDGTGDTPAAMPSGYAVPVKISSRLVPGILIVAGMLVLAYVLWLLLKKKDRRQALWIVLPVLAAAATVCLLALAGGADTSRPIAVIAENMIQDSTGAIRNYSGIDVAAPAGGRHRFSMPGENLRVRVYDYVEFDEEDEDKRQEPYQLRTCYIAGGENAVTVDNTTPWGEVSLESDSPAAIQGRIEGEVWMEEDGLHGEIVNGTDRKLTAGRLLTTYGFVSVPDLAPGEKAEITLVRSKFKDPQNPVYLDGELYLSNPGLYSVINDALGLSKLRYGTAESQRGSLYSNMITNAADAFRRSRGNYSYGAYESSIFLYCAVPEGGDLPELKADGEKVERQTCLSLLTAEMDYAAVGRSGILFRAGIDLPVRVNIDENRMPVGKAAQSGKTDYYFPLSETPTFLFTFEGIGGVRVERLVVTMETYYSGMVKSYALNVSTNEWEEFRVNEEIDSPERYLDDEGRLYLQFRADTQDMYAEIPTPMITLEGRREHAEN